MIDDKLLSSFTIVATQAASLAAEVLMKSYQKEDFEISFKKEKQDIVTQVDKDSEALIKSYLLNYFPDHSLLAEESGFTKQSTEFTWVIDPLDGTVNYAHGLPLFSVSLALFHYETPILGVIHAPALKEVYIVQKGKGASWNGKKLSPIQTSIKFKAPLIAIGLPYNAYQNPQNCMGSFNHLVRLGMPTRDLGVATLDLSYVASNRFSAYYCTILQPWDFAVGSLLIQELGGITTNLFGEPLPAFEASSVVAAGKDYHKPFLQELTKGASNEMAGS